MDELLVKYGATLVGYIIVGLSVFTSVSATDSAVAKLAEHLRKEATGKLLSPHTCIKLTANITGDYVNNTQVLINLGR